MVTKYEYDSEGNLKSRTESYCGCPSVVPGTTHYTYNKYGQVTSIVLPTGASLHMEYDPYGNMLSMKDGEGSVIQSFTYYPNGLVETETDETGTTTYFYDQFGNLIRSIDPAGKTTTMKYYANGKLEKMVEDNGTPLDPTDDETSTFTYDDLGREKRADYGNGIWVEYGYEGSGADWTTLDAPTIGHIERRFTEDGKLRGWITPDGGTPTFYYDQAGRLWKETDVSGNITTEYGYDEAGRLTSIKDVRTGATTLKRYDPGNRLLEEIDPLGGYTKYTYDPRSGKLTAMERGKYLTDPLTGQLVTVPGTNEYVVDTTVRNQVWTYEYNGTRTTATDPLGRKTTSVQNDYYLPTETIYQQREGRDWNTTTNYLYTNNLQEAKDYPTEITDIGGNDRDFTYDEFGRLWKATDLGNGVYTYTYGENGLELIESPTSQTNSGAITETLRYRYGSLGNLERVTYGDGKFKQMNYRANDNRLGTVTLPSGETITYEYNSAGLVESETTKAPDGTVINTVSYTYENGNVKTVMDSTGKTTYGYDSVTGALSGIDYPNGSGIAYTYDLLGRVKTVTEWAKSDGDRYTTVYDYDAFGNLKSVVDPAKKLTTFVYDDANRLKERLLPNGVTTVYEYDDLDRVQSMLHKNAAGTVLASVTYERKGIGEPTKITREDGSYVMLEYDPALRVKKESHYNQDNELLDEITYTYDAAGKRMASSSKVSGDRSLAYKPGYQLDSIGGAVEEDYDYDTNGRLTLIERDGQTLDLEHDASDRLTVVENETTGEASEYIYDGQGRRVKATVGNRVRQFLVAPSMGSGLESTDLIADANGNLLSNYIYAGGSSPFMRLDANGNPIYYLTDAMGTVIGLADGTGQEVGDFRYDSFGNLRNASGAAANVGALGGDFRFQGQWLESESGLYYFRARDYDPKTGLFLSRDPVDIIETEPESFNPYQFVYNNPYIYSDPTGKFTITELNASMNLQNNLQATWLRQLAVGQAREFIKDKTGEIVGNVLNGIVNRLIPGSIMGEHFNKIVDFQGSGPKFEKYLQGQVCGLFYSLAGPYADRLWLEPTINSETGVPMANGLSCQVNIAQKGKAIPDIIKTGRRSNPDFLIKNGEPKKYQPRNSDAYLVGDIKITVEKAVKDYIIPNHAQWQAMYKHASKYQILPFATYIAFRNFFGSSAYANKADLETDIKKAQVNGLRRGVVLSIISIFD